MKKIKITNPLFLLIFCSTVLFISCKKGVNGADISTENLLSTSTSKFSAMGPVGTTYYIAQAGIVDHSNPATPNSIAWYFAAYGAGNTYVLSTSGVYYALNSTLTVPANSILQGSDSTAINWKLAANASLDNLNMIKLSTGSTLQNLYINGVRRPSTIVKAGTTSNVTIHNCTIFDSKNNFTLAQGSAYTILVDAQGSTNFVLSASLLRRAGSTPKAGDAGQTSKGYAVLLWGATNCSVANNDIGSTLTCGIDITGASTASITDNKIDQTGLNFQTTGPIADAITGYHNWNSNDENFTVLNNTITNSNNHAIHVSGRGINIQNNLITNHYLSGVMVDDWRTTAPGNEYSENVTVKNNRIDDPLCWADYTSSNSNRKVFIDRVNNNLLLDYNVNKDVALNTLPVTSINYRFPSLFGSH